MIITINNDNKLQLFITDKNIKKQLITKLTIMFCDNLTHLADILVIYKRQHNCL